MHIYIYAVTCFWYNHGVAAAAAEPTERQHTSLNFRSMSTQRRLWRWNISDNGHNLCQLKVELCVHKIQFYSIFLYSLCCIWVRTMNIIIWDVGGGGGGADWTNIVCIIGSTTTKEKKTRIGTQFMQNHIYTKEHHTHTQADKHTPFQSSDIILYKMFALPYYNKQQ